MSQELEFRADLHCHSTCSDGTLTPQELVLRASELGLKGVSIADHDAIDSYEIARPIAKEKDILLIPGVEFSSIHKGIEVHVLGYGYDCKDEVLKNFCKGHSLRRGKRLDMILELLKDHGMVITRDDVMETATNTCSLGRPHIALAMISKGYVKNVSEAFDKYLGRGSCCYCSLHPFSTPETIRLIRKARGKVILAHPHIIAESNVIKDLLGMDFDGLEGYYNRIHHDQERYWIKLAQSRGWIITGGSDFHGDVKPEIPMGCSWIGEETFMKLYHYSLEVNGDGLS